MQTSLSFDLNQKQSRDMHVAARVGTTLARYRVKLNSVFEERTDNNYVVDNSDGIADLVAAGSDRWNRR